MELKRTNGFSSIFLSSFLYIYIYIYTYICLCSSQKRKRRLKAKMDCCICTSMPYILRSPRNTICGTCFEGARNMISSIDKLEANSDKPTNSMLCLSNPCKTLMNVASRVSDMKDREDELNEKIIFLSEFVTAFKDQIHTDILLKPGNNGPPIPAHKALMAIRSEVFRNMLDSDECKAPAADSITLTELTHEELESLLEFLYNGSLAEEKMNKHAYPLSLAADKYQIPYLQKLCERHMLKSLSSSNALDVLEIAETCSNQALKETTLKFIVNNLEEIVFSTAFDVFALKNPHLSVQITRASLMDAKRNSVPQK
nr:BTB/POZ domain-containing protein At3g56230 isoform X1 [Ziziphus jujuba var. spinosa]